MERSTKIKDLVKPTCYLLFGTPGYSGSGKCISDKECSECWVHNRRFPKNFQEKSPNPKKESSSKPSKK